MLRSSHIFFSNLKVFENYKLHEGSYTGEADEDGDYKICLDNKDSTWSDKTVWFEVQILDPEDDYDDDDIGDYQVLSRNVSVSYFFFLQIPKNGS